MFVSTSLNTEDFVNHVDQAHRLYRTTRPRRPYYNSYDC